MYMLEPYDPGKIPVLLVHGLWSSPLTWMEMFNDLRSFPEIRDQYQFWFYLYPTGQPFWISAAQLRADLIQALEIVDPEHRSPALQQMVLIGHSMGGLVSRLQAFDSGEDYWRILSDRSFGELQTDPETRERLARTVFFTPNPAIRRVITIGTPHRGSEFANDYTRWLGRKLITLPEMMVRISEKLARDNPGVFRDTAMLTINTSIDSLAPDSPIFPVMLNSQRAPWTRFHNIVGVLPHQGLVGRIAGEGDGVVSFASAHLDDVTSEIVIPADHLTVHRHPQAILEVRRILLDHRAAALAEMRSPWHATLPASFPPTRAGEFQAEPRL
jgi:pimeloyl-ACP methyl ester carboxylesterase